MNTMQPDDSGSADSARRDVPIATRRGVLRSAAAGMLGGATGLFLASCGGNNGSAGAAGNDQLLGQTATEIAADELAHVRFIRQTITSLGGTPVAKPAINLNPQSLPNSINTFLILSRAFEDTGVSAYGGAAPLISSKVVLGAAARILATEAYHAGNIRFQVVERGIAVSAVDGSDQPPTAANQFPTDVNGLAVIRTPAQVLAIVTPFFPNGPNGTTSPATDLEILNFALNLEYLEAEFYSFATTGAGLGNADITGSGTAGATANGFRVTF
jgi:hypothetical protein